MSSPQKYNKTLNISQVSLVYLYDLNNEIGVNSQKKTPQFQTREKALIKV